MKTINVNAYLYDELTPQAQEKAREWYRGTMNDCFDFEVDAITESMLYTIEEAGYPDMTPTWSLGHCQGDGATFYGALDAGTIDSLATRLLDVKDVRRWNRLTAAHGGFSGKITHSGRYSHAYSVDVEVDSSGVWRLDRCEALIERLQAAILSDVRRVSFELERQGYAEIDYLYSDEAVIDAIDANEWLFTSEGKRSITLGAAI